MKEFFKGWKRKVGCVTLMLACVLTTGWIRSQKNADNLLIAGRWQCLGFTSERGNLWWIRNWATDGSERQVLRRFNWNSFPAKPLPADFVPKYPEIYAWRIRGFGFDLYRCDYDGSNQSAAVWIVPYWSLVLPLTLLSGWLLLSKQPPVNRPVEPSKDQP